MPIICPFSENSISWGFEWGLIANEVIMKSSVKFCMWSTDNCADNINPFCL